jgi:hypothetical protein
MEHLDSGTLKAVYSSMFSMSLDHFAWTLKLSFVCNQLNTTSGGNLLENQYCLFHEIHNHNLQSQS